MKNNVHQEFVKIFLKMNKITNVENIKLDKELLEKEKEVFLYDESLKKNKSTETKDKKNKKFKEKKGDRKKKKPFGPSVEKEITNFKFKNLDDYNW